MAIAVAVVAVVLAVLAVTAAVKLRRAGARADEARTIGLHLRALKAANKAVNSAELPASANGTLPGQGHIKLVGRGDEPATPLEADEAGGPVVAVAEEAPVSLAGAEAPVSLAGGEAPA